MRTHSSRSPAHGLHPNTTALDPLVARATRRWWLAAAFGALSASVLGVASHELQLPPFVQAAFSISGGLLTIWMLHPNRCMRMLAKDQRAAIEDYRRKLAAFADGDRRVAVRDLITETDDELARLSCVVHDIIADAASARLRSRLLHKQLDHSIQRATKLATADLQRQAMTDALTGLGNRRALDHWLEEHFSQLAVEQQFSVVAIDLDRFKQVNDTLGHESGDRCLAYLGQLLRSNVRRTDCAIRLGGDEFVVILVNCNVEAARIMAVRVASLFQRIPWTSVEVARPTLSAGFASSTVGSPDQVMALLRQADEDLYRSKSNRRESETAKKSR